MLQIFLEWWYTFRRIITIVFWIYLLFRTYISISDESNIFENPFVDSLQIYIHHSRLYSKIKEFSTFILLKSHFFIVKSIAKDVKLKKFDSFLIFLSIVFIFFGFNSNYFFCCLYIFSINSLVMQIKETNKFNCESKFKKFTVGVMFLRLVLIFTGFLVAFLTGNIFFFLWSFTNIICIMRYYMDF